MKTEKVVISFIAVGIGIFVAAVAFYLYQTTKMVSTSETKTICISPTIPVPKSSIFLNLDTPKDEDVANTKTVTLTGSTSLNTVVIITTSSNDQVITPAANGNFSTTVVLDNGENKIEIAAVAPNGEEAKLIRTVTVSTESF